MQLIYFTHAIESVKDTDYEVDDDFEEHEINTYNVELALKCVVKVIENHLQ